MCIWAASALERRDSTPMKAIGISFKGNTVEPLLTAGLRNTADTMGTEVLIRDRT